MFRENNALVFSDFGLSQQWTLCKSMDRLCKIWSFRGVKIDGAPNTDFKQQRTSLGGFSGGQGLKLNLHIASCQLDIKNDVRKNYSTRLIHLAWLQLRTM